MLQLPDNLQIIRPIVPLEQLQHRNKFFKNWGKLNPLFFKRNQPQIVLPPYKSVAEIIVFFIILFFINFKYSQNQLYCLVRQIIFFIALYFYFLACQCDHGSAASGLPMLNYQIFTQYRGFCDECLVFTGDVGKQIDLKMGENSGKKSSLTAELQTISHCKQCRTCFYGIYYHSLFLGICVTSTNFWKILRFNITCFLLLISIVLIPVIG